MTGHLVKPVQSDVSYCVRRHLRSRCEHMCESPKKDYVIWISLTPEWFFLSIFGIIKIIPDKLTGFATFILVFAMVFISGLIHSSGNEITFQVNLVKVPSCVIWHMSDLISMVMILVFPILTITRSMLFLMLLGFVNI